MGEKRPAGVKVPKFTGGGTGAGGPERGGNAGIIDAYVKVI
jgi:hypothetical protein